MLEIQLTKLLQTCSNVFPPFKNNDRLTIIISIAVQDYVLFGALYFHSTNFFFGLE